MSDVEAELEELRESVAALRAELHRRFGVSGRPPAAPQTSPLPETGEVWLETLADRVQSGLEGVDPVKLYDELRRRFGVLGRSDVGADVDAFGLDPRYLERARRVLDFLYDTWWRVHVSGAEQIPDSGRTMFVANRSGVLPYDGAMIAHAVEREHPSHRRPRFLVADWLVTLPFFQPWLARVGGVRACPENAERLLELGEWVVVFPEGQKGALKPFRDRYHLTRFGRGGFVPLALRQKARIVPVAVVGAEEVHPLLSKPALLARLVGAPFPITPTFPLLGVLGAVPLPTQWRIRFGEAFDLGDAPPGAADDPLYVSRTRERVRGKIQELVEEEVGRRRSVWS